MNQFEYEISKHPSKEFTHIAYFCSEEGECSIHEIPIDQTRILEGLLNERGSAGWELSQMVFGKDGVLIIWKRIK